MSTTLAFSRTNNGLHSLQSASTTDSPRQVVATTRPPQGGQYESTVPPEGVWASSDVHQDSAFFHQTSTSAERGVAGRYPLTTSL